MLALIATNVVGAVLFAAVYATAGARLMSHAAFLVCLPLIFALVTTLWVRAERRHARLPPLRRLWRAVAALGLTVIGVPAVVLLPLAKLDGLLPPEAGIERASAVAMALLLISLVLIVLANLLGALVILARRRRAID